MAIAIELRGLRFALADLIFVKFLQGLPCHTLAQCFR